MRSFLERDVALFAPRIPAETLRRFWIMLADPVARMSWEGFAIEIKRSLAPSVSKGFHLGAVEIEATDNLVVYPGSTRFPLGNDTHAVPLPALMTRFANAQKS